MYIRSFHMDGFGIYADVKVENLSPGLTIFLGENEAGKSTCMEFLRTMLTGYPDRRSREAKTVPGPLRGGQAGGGMLLHTKERGDLHLTRRPGINGGLLTLTDANGTPLENDILKQVLCGVSREVYRKVFGFSLTELEDLNSLTGEGVRNALYGASFGPGLRAPGEALAILHKRGDEIFKFGGSKPSLNALLRELTDVRHHKAELEQAGAGYDALARELGQRREELAALRRRRLELEEERRLLERRLNVWQQWNEWRLVGTSLERLPPANTAFPEDGRARLAQAREAREGCERQWTALKEKLDRLRERRDTVVPDAALLEALPELRRLAERKSGFRQALTDLPVYEETVRRTEDDLCKELSRLGPDWTCQRIRHTDRSLFAREDMERQARELDAAFSTHQAAVDTLHACNRDVENAQHEVASAEAALALLPAPVAELDAEARDALRQFLTRQEEAHRQLPSREHALEEARTSFTRTWAPLRLTANAITESHGADAQLDALLERQEKALELAGTVQEQIRQAEAATLAVNQSEENVASLKKRMENLRKEQRLEGLNRSELDAQASALRKLRALSASLDTERERLADLTSRIDSEPPIKAVRNLPLLLLAIAAILGGTAMLLTVWRLGPLTLPITESLALPVDLWSGYLLLFCGVGFLAGALPHNGAERKRRKQEFEQLRGRRDACALHITELHQQAATLCDQANIESLDLITIEAREALLEYEREQCFQEERLRKEMDSLKQALEEAREQVALRQSARSEAEAHVQQIRRRWHEFMLDLHVNNVPSPEGAAAFFARAESARMAFGTMAAAETELRALENDIRSAQEQMLAVPAVAERLRGTQNVHTLNDQALNDAVRQVLESCREADAAREQHIKAEAALQNAKNELRRAGMRQSEASEGLQRIHERLESSRSKWQEALQKLGLGENLAPETVREALKYMENCLVAESKLEEAQSRLSRSRAELEALQGPLESLLERLGRHPLKDATDQPDWLRCLDNALTDAENASASLAHRQNLDTAVNDAEDECRAAEAALDNARAAENALLTMAGAVDDEDFLRQAALHDERENLTRRLRDLEDALRLAAGNVPWQEFLAAFEAQNQETQERRCGTIGEELNEMREQEERLVQRTSELDSKVEALTHTDELSRLLLREASLVDSMERLAFEWSKLALARGILESAKRSFEKERQPEVIRQASRIFSAITGHRWQGISASLENSTLLILPEHGEPVNPENLSRGTREQAYLALRLAYIANHAANASPLPIIMDEVLVNFDTQRAERTARAFVELTAEGQDKAHQLFYFTCHPHIADLLRRAEPHAAFYLVEDGNIRAA